MRLSSGLATAGMTVTTVPPRHPGLLDALPFPAWDLVDIARYRDVWRAPRLLLDERGDRARLPVPLQLVREADLGPALPPVRTPENVAPSWGG